MSARKRGAAREVFRLQSSAVPRISREGDRWEGADTQEGPSLYRGEEMRCPEQGPSGHAGGAEGREAVDGEDEGNEKGRSFRNGPSCLCHEALGEDFRL